jgi:hypothetical protein
MPNERSFIPAAAGLAPLMASSAGALASLALFRPWIELTLGSEGSSATLRGGTLARQAIFSVPWIYVTPAALVVIIVLAALLLFNQRRVTRIAGGLVMALLAASSVAWPVTALARFVRNVSRLNSSGFPSNIALTPWWWLYCGSLAVVMVSGIILVAAAIRNESTAEPPA